MLDQQDFGLKNEARFTNCVRYVKCSSGAHPVLVLRGFRTMYMCVYLIVNDLFCTQSIGTQMGPCVSACDSRAFVLSDFELTSFHCIKESYSFMRCKSKLF